MQNDSLTLITCNLRFENFVRSRKKIGASLYYQFVICTWNCTSTKTRKKKDEMLAWISQFCQIHAKDKATYHRRLKSIAFYKNKSGRKVNNLTPNFKEIVNPRLDRSVYLTVISGLNKETNNSVRQSILRIHRAYVIKSVSVNGYCSIMGIVASKEFLRRT